VVTHSRGAFFIWSTGSIGKNAKLTIFFWPEIHLARNAFDQPRSWPTTLLANAFIGKKLVFTKIQWAGIPLAGKSTI